METVLQEGGCVGRPLSSEPLQKPLHKTMVAWIRGLTVDVVSRGNI